MDRHEIPDEDFNKPVKSGERKPLPLLPQREWLTAAIVEVKYQYVIFNNEIQYMTDKDENQILDSDSNPIPRREFEITFEFHDFFLPNDKPRKAWLRLSASFGESAHLPVFLWGVIPGHKLSTPAQIIEALKGKDVKLQLKNKASKKDPKKIFQNVIWDSVQKIDANTGTPEPELLDPEDLDPEQPF